MYTHAIKNNITKNMFYMFVNVLRYSYICLYVIELAVTLTAVHRLLNTLMGGVLCFYAVHGRAYK